MENRNAWQSAALWAALSLVLACSPGGSSSATAGSTSGANAFPAGSGSLPCDVAQVLATRCQSCHASPPLFGAPMPLVTFADLHAATPSSPSVPVYTSVETRTHDDARPMPPAPNARLSATEQATLDSWIAAGAPSGDGRACAPVVTSNDGGGAISPTGDDGGAAPTDCAFDTHVAPASPYTMVGPEQYACYGFDIAATGERQVTQIQVRLDNKSIVHHILLLKSPTSVSGTPTPCSPAPSFGAPMIYAWAPGGNALVLPSEAGFPQDQTTHYVVQVHYNNAANSPNTTDATGFDLCTTANLRKYNADVLAFGTELISVPPHAAATTTSCYTIPAALDGRSFFAAFPHMHQLGTSIGTELLTDGGAPVDMGTIAHWQFSEQPWLPITAYGTAGDVIRTTCSWTNTGDSTVTFGQSTTDEMCYSFTAYYPVASTSLGWSAPATLSVPCP